MREEELIYGDVNITAFRLLNPDDSIVRDVVTSWNLWKGIGASLFETNSPSWVRKNPPSALIPSEMPELKNGTLKVISMIAHKRCWYRS